jgi:hypothetical protein
LASLKKIGLVLEQAKEAAIKYYQITGKPLGITGEIGEYLVAKKLHLKLSNAREPGYDAIDKTGRLIQIKSRSIPTGKRIAGQRTGSIRLDHKWNVILLLVMNEKFEPYVMYEADRASIKKALRKPGSKARNERGALSISKFKSIGKQVWPKPKA